MIKLFTALIVAMIFLGACGNEPAPQRMQVADVNLPDTYDEVQAQAAYQKACLVCHGGDLQGAGAYPYPITGISKEELYIAIVEGVGRMPGKLVSNEDAENLAVWIADQ